MPLFIKSEDGRTLCFLKGFAAVSHLFLHLDFDGNVYTNSLCLN